MRRKILGFIVMLVCIFCIGTASVYAVTGSEIVNDLINNYVGKYQYIYGTHGPNTFDCSGLVYYVYNQHGITLPYTTKTDWTQYGTVITDTSQLKDGDILLFGSSWSSLNHMGIYDSNGGYIIQALNENRDIIREPTLSTWINSPGWNSNGNNQFQYAVRVIDTEPPSNLANIPNGVYSIQHNNSGLYLSAGANNENGYDTFLYEFGNNGDYGLDQKFYLERLSNNAYKIISQYDNKVIEVDSLSMNDEAHIQKWNYNGVSSQQWYIVDRGDGYYKFINVNSGKAMDIGSYVQQWTDNNTDAQKFKIEAATHTMSANIPNGVYAIQFKKTGLYLSAGANNENGYDTFLYEPGNKGLLGEDQKFYLERLSNNAYKIISQYDKKVIEVDNLSYNDQAHIQKWNYNNVASQNWVIIDCGDGYYNFINKHSGKALDMGNYVWQWEYNNTDAQKFKIIPINYTIKYSANGGIGAPATQTKIYLKDLYLNSTTPTRDGYKFAGWNTSSNGKGTAYNAGDAYSLNADVTLYAQWEANPTTSTTAARTSGAIEVQTTISNLSQTASYVAAVYDSSGNLLGQTTNNIDSGTQSVTVYLPSYTNASYVKVYLWNSLNGMKPLTDGEKVSL